MGGRFVSEPFVVAFPMRLGIFHNGVTILNADGIIEPPYRLGTAPKIAKLPGAIQRGGVPDNVVMDVRLVHMGTDNKSVIALGEPHCQFAAQAVGLFRGDLARDKGLSYLIGQHIIGSALPAGFGGVPLFGKKKFSISNPAVTLVAGYEPAAVCLFWVLHIAQNIADSRSRSTAFASVQGDEAGSSDLLSLLCGIKCAPAYTTSYRIYYTA